MIHGKRAWLFVVAAWTLLGLLESAKGYITLGAQGIHQVWWWALLANMPWWWAWAALTPVAFQCAARAPFTAARWRRGAAIHTVAAFALASLHVVGTAVLAHWLTGVRTPIPLVRRIWLFVTNYLVIDLVVYAAIIGVYFAFDYARRLRETSLASAQLETRAARLELGLADARLQTLRMELNPHFLFNTLNAISGLVRRQQTDAAVGMLARLGDLLRVTLDRGLPQQIALEDELELLRHYLDIEKARFGARLVVTIDIDPGARDALVPTLVCQPLVENAVRHGVSRRSGAVAVTVRAWVEGATLTLEIRDTGRGLGSSPIRDGIGLSNTRARLHEMYGDRASLDLGDAVGGGTVASVHLPFRQASRHEHVPASA